MVNLAGVRARPRRKRRLALIAALAVPALVLSGLAPGAVASTTPDTSVPANAVVFYDVTDGADPVALAARLVAAGFEVEGRTTDGVSIIGNASTRAQLDAVDGLTVVNTTVIDPVVAAGPDGGSQDAILPKRLDGKHYDTYYGGYRTVDAFYKFSDDIGAAYPDLAKVRNYGKSYQGRNLRTICITANADQGCGLNPDTDKARFLLVTQIHARELTTAEVSWRYMTYLLDGYKKDAQVTALLDSTEVWIVPQVNPDGSHVVEDGIRDQGLGEDSPAWQRKNLNPGDVDCTGTWAFSHRGVDLNRNYPSHWGGAGTDPNQCGQTWPGVEENSEPETYKLVDLAQDLFRDQRADGDDAMAPLSATGALLSLHTAANLVLFPWGFDADIQAPNDEGLRSYAFRASYYNGYITGQPGEVLYEVSGSTDDWSYDDLGIASGTWELGPGAGSCGGFHPLYTCQDAFFDLNVPALMYQAVAARTPYKFSLGPTVLSAKLAQPKTQPMTEPAGRVTVKIKADDGALGTQGPNPPDSQNTTAARIFLDKAPWDGGTATAMKIKGSGPAVTASVTVRATSTKKLAWTQAKDADGNWGPIRAVWIKL
jgi:carboxypeptidase T